MWLNKADKNISLIVTASKLELEPFLSILITIIKMFLSYWVFLDMMLWRRKRIIGKL